MKRTIYLTFILLSPLFALAKGFIVKGRIDGLQAGTVSLTYVNQNEKDTTLTTRITAGTFTLAGIAEDPELARFTITEGWSYSISFFIENATISIHLVKDAPDKTTISGSVSDVIYEKLKPGLSDFFEHARQNNAAHQQASAVHDNHALQVADSLWTVQQAQWIQSIRMSIGSNSENYPALYFIQWLLFKPDNLNTIQSAFMQLSPAVRQSSAGRKFLDDFEHLNKTASDHAVKLTAFRGKIVLLDFWASYCGPCRQENKRMLNVYQKYHPAGFEIVSFSLDNERSLWLKAMQADGLTWPQASDLRGGAGATAGDYDITDLPRNVLIDKSGNIYSRDLHGEDLIRAIESLLGK